MEDMPLGKRFRIFFSMMQWLHILVVKIWLTRINIMGSRRLVVLVQYIGYHDLQTCLTSFHWAL
jgi:hypothetical protein